MSGYSLYYTCADSRFWINSHKHLSINLLLFGYFLFWMTASDSITRIGLKLTVLNSMAFDLLQSQRMRFQIWAIAHSSTDLWKLCFQFPMQKFIIYLRCSHRKKSRIEQLSIYRQKHELMVIISHVPREGPKMIIGEVIRHNNIRTLEL